MPVKAHREIVAIEMLWQESITYLGLELCKFRVPHLHWETGVDIILKTLWHFPPGGGRSHLRDRGTNSSRSIKSVAVASQQVDSLSVIAAVRHTASTEHLTIVTQPTDCDSSSIDGHSVEFISCHVSSIPLIRREGGRKGHHQTGPTEEGIPQSVLMRSVPDLLDRDFYHWRETSHIKAELISRRMSHLPQSEVPHLRRHTRRPTSTSTDEGSLW